MRPDDSTARLTINEAMTCRRCGDGTVPGDRLEAINTAVAPLTMPGYAAGGSINGDLRRKPAEKNIIGESIGDPERRSEAK